MGVRDIQKVGVLGAGIMGHGIAMSFVMEGFPVTLYDVNQGVLDVASHHIEEGLRLFADSGLLDHDRITPSLERLSTTLDLKEA
ncbi:MAG: hypothetical protein JRJ18_13985, partial [Deltaproteobacteria bacterium]|nr:hypothetical protein [Deltaproteobacteria bacterium]